MNSSFIKLLVIQLLWFCLLRTAEGGERKKNLNVKIVNVRIPKQLGKKDAKSCIRFSHEKITTCRECKEDYYLSRDGKCFKQNIPGCLLYVKGKNECLEIDSSIASARVLQTVANCKLYQRVNGVRVCKICKTNYYLSNNQCLVQSVPNCQTYRRNKNECKTCKTNYYLSGTICLLQSVSGCIGYIKNKNQCKTCAAQFCLANGLCISSTNPNCLTLICGTQICSQCKNLFYLDTANGNNCLPLTSLYSANCVTSNGINNLCTTCIATFAPINGVCTQNFPSQCILVDGNSNLCLHCSPTYYLNSGYCLKVTDPLGKCINSNGVDNICTECSEPLVYEILNGVCSLIPVVPIPFCHIQVGSLCQECVPLYYPSSTSTACISINVANCALSNGITEICTRCNAVNLYVTNNNLCQQQSILNCSVYVDYHNQCTQCLSGHFVNGFICEQIENCVQSLGILNVCNECASSYKIVSGLCVEISDCFESDGISNCITCDTNFYLLNGGCAEQNNPDCQGFIPNFNTCNQCFSLKYPVNGVCTPISEPNCAESNGIVNQCITCINLYYPLQNSCVKITDFDRCLTSSGNVDQCMNCKSQYQLFQNQCVLYQELGIPHCQSTEPYFISMNNPTLPFGTYETCFSCDYEGYYIDLFFPATYANRCLKIDNCQQSLGEQPICIECKPNHYFEFFHYGFPQCVEHSSSNGCALYFGSENKCLSCNNPLHFPNAQQKCVQPVSCSQEEPGSPGLCTLCPLNHYLKNKKCFPISDNHNNCDCPLLWHDDDFCCQCKPGYRLYRYKCILIGPTPNCVAYDVNNVCQECEYYYKLTPTNECVATGLDCAVVDPITNNCLLCNFGSYDLNGSKDSTTPKNCKTFPYMHFISTFNDKRYINNERESNTLLGVVTLSALQSIDINGDVLSSFGIEILYDYPTYTQTFFESSGYHMIFDSSTRKTKIRRIVRANRYFPTILPEPNSPNLMNSLRLNPNGSLELVSMNNIPDPNLESQFSFIPNYNENGLFDIALKNELMTDHKVFVKNLDDSISIIQSNQKTIDQRTIRVSFSSAYSIRALSLNNRYLYNV